MNDLEWLARNVHKWGCHNCDLIRFDNEFSKVTYGESKTHLFPRNQYYTHDQWQAERARLQNKPSWDSHNWPSIFQCESGHWFGVRNGWNLKDHITKGWKGYYVSLIYKDGEYLTSGEILGDWRDSQEKRPESVKEIKFPEGVNWMGDTKEYVTNINSGDTFAFTGTTEPKQNATIGEIADAVLNSVNDRANNKEWKQDELPPVGEECEVYRNGEWEMCEIIAHIDQPMGTIAVFSYGREPGYGISGVDCLIPRYFRPVDVSRTEEEKAVEEMMQVIHNEYTATQAVLIEQACRRLHQSGYRKLDNPNASN